MKFNWHYAKLSDISFINPKETLTKGTLAKKIPMDTLRPFSRDVLEYTTEIYSGGTKFRNGDTIMARITPCLENGKTSMINILDENEIGFGSTEYIVFRAKSGISDPYYLYYLICSPIVRNPAIKSMVGSSGRQRVQTDVVSNLELFIPDYLEQVKIGSLLKSIDDKISLNNEINKNLYEQIQTLCNGWFVEFQPFGGEMPNDWSLTPLSEIASFDGGYSYKGNELQKSNIAMATIKNFDRNGGFKLDGFKEIIPSSKLKNTQHVELFDTLVAHTDLTQGAEVIGNAEVMLSKSGYDDIVFSMDLVKVLPKSSNISKFLIAAILHDSKFKSHCLGYVNGTTVLHLSKKALPDYALYLPEDLSVLKPLDNALSVIYKQIANNIEENLKLTSLRDSLLPKLMSGEIDVSEIEI